MQTVFVITVCWNAVNLIEETIKSVLSQTYQHVKYLIIDGGSTDGTVDIIRKYEDQLTFWVSEPDKGIYDAMNKGLRKAYELFKNPDVWINFMNAGDSFVDERVIEEIFYDREYTDKIKIIGGHICNHFKGQTEIHYADSPTIIPYHIPICHQAAFTRLLLSKESEEPFQFNLKYKYAADYDLYYQVYYNFDKEKSFQIVNRVVANCMQDDSTTFNNLNKIKGEYLAIQSAHRSWKWWKEYLKWRLL